MTDLANAPTAGLGETVVFGDRYEVRALLGQGGMGSVFRVLDRELDEEIALKVLSKGSSDPKAIDRFRREVKLARRVTHPNVARTYDLGQHDQSKFITMELVIGEPISVLMKGERAVPLAAALRIAEQVARGLSAAHAAGVVHRDLKPDNVMCCRADGRIVITDFGIARLAEGKGDVLATANQILGTPAYMAPEQISGDPIDGRTDVYAFGTLLFEMLTGVLPFQRDSVLAMLGARLTADAPDPRTVDANIPEPVADLVNKTLARKRDDRPDAEMMLQAIERLRGSGDRHVQLQSSTSIRELARAPTRSIAIAPIDLEDVGAALADGLSTVHGLEVLPPSVVRDAMKDRDARSAARTLGASFLLDASVRIEGTKARGRARLVDVERGTQIWATAPIDVAHDATFELEDRLVASVIEAMQKRLGSGANENADPAIKPYYERAQEAARDRSVPGARAAIALIDDALQKFPGDSWLLCLLGTSLVRLWSYTGSHDLALAARAEEMALRALAADPSLGYAYHTIGMLRLEQGELRASVRAFQEARARSPLFAEPNIGLGILLAETGNVEEATQRFDAAIRLDRASPAAWLERARVKALLGDRAGAESDLKETGAVGTQLLVRSVVWWNDRARALELAESFAKSPTGAAWESAGPLLAALGASVPIPNLPEVFKNLPALAGATVRNRCRITEAAAELCAMSGDVESAFAFLDQASSLPFVNVLWLDRCPCLDPLRSDPRFARVRGRVAARAADLWR